MSARITRVELTAYGSQIEIQITVNERGFKAAQIPVPDDYRAAILAYFADPS